LCRGWKKHNNTTGITTGGSRNSCEKLLAELLLPYPVADQAKAV